MEMIAAVAITAILASVLSVMTVPVLRTYNANRVRSELASAVTSRLNDIAYHLRGATGVYLASGAKSFPEIRNYSPYQVQYSAMRYYGAKYGFALDNYYETNAPKVKGYLYPEMKIADYDDPEKPVLRWPSNSKYNMKLESDEYQTSSISCASTDDFYFYVRSNPDDGGSATALEIHLNVEKNGIRYEGSKTIVCENLVISGDVIHTAGFSWDNTNKVYVLSNASVASGTNASNWKKYCSVWFAKGNG